MAALPYMLKRGRLRRKFGDEASDALVPLAEVMPLAIQPSAGWLEPLTAVDSIDPGEAQLLAASAERGLLLLTGDKRGLHGVKDIPGYAEALDGHVVVFEAILAELCVQLGAKEIGSRIRPLVGGGHCNRGLLLSVKRLPVNRASIVLRRLISQSWTVELVATVLFGGDMTFGPNHYVPVLKVKRGEKQALAPYLAWIATACDAVVGDRRTQERRRLLMRICRRALET